MWSDPWSTPLDSEEEILWQGRPDGSISFKRSMTFRAFFAIFLIAVVSASLFNGAENGPVAVLFVGLGILVLVSDILRKQLAHRQITYALSNKRALVRKDRFFAKPVITSLSVSAQTKTDYQDGQPPSLILTNNDAFPLVFKHIDDAQTVLSLIRRIQKDAT